MRPPTTLIITALAVAGLATACAAQPDRETVGDAQAVRIADDGAVQLRADDPITAGAIDRPISVGGADAAMALIDVEQAPARGVTIALLDARQGDTVSYWQNPFALAPATSVGVLLPVPRDAPRVRLFAGTHDQPSSATIRVGDVVPVRRIARYRTVMYGSAVSTDSWVAQSFTARGTKLAGIMIYTSLRGERSSDSPDLVARLFEWRDNINDTRAAEPLARTVVPHRRLPAGRPLGRDIELFIPLRSEVKPGGKYVIDFTSPSGDPEQRYLLWCGPDGYDGGQQFIDGRARDWDLHMEIYEEVRP